MSSYKTQAGVELSPTPSMTKSYYINYILHGYVHDMMRLSVRCVCDVSSVLLCIYLSVSEYACTCIHVYKAIHVVYIYVLLQLVYLLWLCWDIYMLIFTDILTEDNTMTLCCILYVYIRIQGRSIKESFLWYTYFKIIIHLRTVFKSGRRYAHNLYFNIYNQKYIDDLIVIPHILIPNYSNISRK